MTEAASGSEGPEVTERLGSGEASAGGEQVPGASERSLGPGRAAAVPGRSDIPRTRAGAAWVAAGVGIVLLVAVLVFILENLEDASVHFLGASVRLPVGVALLFSALAGALAVLLLGVARIVQLRLLARRRGDTSG